MSLDRETVDLIRQTRNEAESWQGLVKLGLVDLLQANGFKHIHYSSKYSHHIFVDEQVPKTIVVLKDVYNTLLATQPPEKFLEKVIRKLTRKPRKIYRPNELNQVGFIHYEFSKRPILLDVHACFTETGKILVNLDNKLIHMQQLKFQLQRELKRAEILAEGGCTDINIMLK